MPRAHPSTDGPSRRPAALGLAILALVGAIVHAQPDGEPAPTPKLQVTGQLEVARLIDLAAAQLKVTVEYDAGAIKGTATLRVDGGLTDPELWELLNRALAARGFTTVRAHSITPEARPAFTVVKVSDAASLAPIETSDPAFPAPGFVSRLVRIEHRTVREVVDTLGKTLSKPGGAVAAFGEGAGGGAGGGGGGGGAAPPRGEGGTILISDLTPRVKQALELLRLFDKPAEEGRRTVVREIPALHLTATQLATLFAQTVAKRRLVSGEDVPGELLAGADERHVLLVAPESRVEFWTGILAQLDRREPVHAKAYTPRYFPADQVAPILEQSVRDTTDDRWRLVTDALTGTLFVTATPTQHEAVRAMLASLDAAPPASQRPVRSFVVKNRSVAEIQNILERLLQAGVLGPESAVTEPADPTAGVSPPEVSNAPAGPLGDAANLSAAARSRSFGRSEPDVGSGPSSHGAAGPLDRPLVLTSDEGTNTLIAVGEPRLLAQVETLLKSLDVRQPQVMLEVMMVSLSEGKTLDLGVELEKLRISDDLFIRLSSLFGLGTRNANGDRSAGDASGFTGVVLSPGDFSVVVRALQTVNDGRSLSMPKLLVGNNQAATIDSTLQQPFASVNAGDTIATTSFGGTLDAGTVVSIKPQIAEGDHLLLDYAVSLSSFAGPAASATLPPPRAQNRVKSVATIPDGYTVVVGGIDIETDNNSESKVPLLGDIPLVGEAFKSRSKNSSRSRFFVFIRANVLRGRGTGGGTGGFEDLKYLSDQDVARARVDDGWPEVKPRVIR